MQFLAPLGRDEKIDAHMDENQEQRKIARQSTKGRIKMNT